MRPSPPSASYRATLLDQKSPTPNHHVFFVVRATLPGDARGPKEPGGEQAEDTGEEEGRDHGPGGAVPSPGQGIV